MPEETPISSADDSSAGAESSVATYEWESNGPGAQSNVVATDVAAAASPDDGSAFLAHLARAMKEAATAERTRVTADIDRRRDAHIAGIESRRETEAGRIRELANEDRRTIDAWVEAEQRRINDERDRRTAALGADLETSLAEHGAKIDAEKELVESAITSYRSDVDAYFSKLEGETDPVAIALHAGQRPAFPDLDAIGIEAAAATAAPAAPAAPAEASAERPPAVPATTGLMIGVMATSRPTTKLSQAWAAWTASTAAAEADEAARAEVDAGAETTPEAEPAAAVEPPPAVGAVAAAMIDSLAGSSSEARGAIASLAPQVNPVEPYVEPVVQPVAVAAGAPEPAAAPTPAAAPPPPPQSQSTFGGMSWLRRDKSNDQANK